MPAWLSRKSDGMVLEKEDIKKVLRHRDPMLLVDRMEKKDGYVTATYTVRGDEAFLQGHFPGNPIVPGVVICEIMAQSCVLLINNPSDDKLPVYAGLDKVRFKGMVKPGETITVTAGIREQRGDYYLLDARAEVGGKICCKGLLGIFLTEFNH